ncbi:citrate transporter family protein [Mycobacterium intracellulare 1956]|uniref:Citrate transporter family protein n=1 Tax=Mycobacterium intracellulare 1956 TaxID=1299331 RepID=X8CH79_MYCIT|nr:citrate transporter family protein [Mycobacterium intracellulare 1956]
MSFIAILVFVVAYALIASDRVNKTFVALAGAAIVVMLPIIHSDDIFYSHGTGIDWDVIFLLLGMMIIVSVLRQTGVFEYVAIWSAKRARGSPLRVMILLALVTAIASALLDNVTTVLLIAPVTLLVCERLAINAAPFLMAEVFASNVGGAATLVGDPPNIIIASKGGLTFNDFLVHLAPIVIIVIAVLIALLPRLFPGAFSVDPDRAADVMSLEEKEAIRDPGCSSRAGSCCWRCSPHSSPTRRCTWSPRWWRCWVPGSWSWRRGSSPRTTCPAWSGTRCCSLPVCSSWSAPW